MNDLFRYNEDPAWTGCDYNGMEHYQAWYGTMCTGDLDLLASRLTPYIRLMPALQRWVQENYRHAGTIHPYNHMVAQPYLGNGAISAKLVESDGRPLAWNANGNLYMLMLGCDYVALGGDEATDSRGTAALGHRSLGVLSRALSA